METKDAIETIIGWGYGFILRPHPAKNGEYMGCLIDPQTAARIPGSDLWEWQPSYGEALEKLAHMASSFGQS